MKIEKKGQLEIVSYEVKLDDGRIFAYKEYWDQYEGLIDTDVSASFKVPKKVLEELEENLRDC